MRDDLHRLTLQRFLGFRAQTHRSRREVKVLSGFNCVLQALRRVHYENLAMVGVLVADRYWLCQLSLGRGRL